MKRCIYFYIACIGMFSAGNELAAQEFMPFYSSSYSGVTGVGLQPASIAESKFKADITVLGSSVGYHGNFYNMDHGLIFNSETSGYPVFLLSKLGKSLIFQDVHSKDIISDLREKYHDDVTPDFSGNYKGLNFFAEIQLLNIMISLTDRSAMAFGYKQRAFFNVDVDSKNGFGKFDTYYSTKDDVEIVDPQLNYLNGQAAWWHEFDLTYSQILINGKKHVLKAGVTGKLALSKASGYVHASNVNVDVWGAKKAVDANYTGTFDNGILGYSWNRGGVGFGADFGVEYEYRPYPDLTRFDMDGKTGIRDRSENAYLLKLGLSFLNVGFVNHKAKAYTASKIDNNYSEINSWDNLIAAVAQKKAESYDMNMPMVMSAQFDWNIGKGYYLNFIPYWAFNSKGKDNSINVHSFSSYNLTPRFETKKWGIFLPFQYDQFKNANVGIALRMGPLWLGSSTLLTNVLKNNNNYATDIHLLLKLSILYQKPKDRDNDKVSDKNDICPDVPGLLKFQGCPDTDGDGVPDNLDKCPNTPPGIGVDEHGCPLDSDGDGVPDYRDKCPDSPQGVVVDENGCPLDSDGDGVPDYLDKCPDTPVSVEVDKDGCPVKPNIDILPVKFTVIGEGGTSEIINYGALYFDFNKASIKKASYPLLNHIAQELRAEKNLKLNLCGHTDSIGSYGYNMILSGKRAQSVKIYLLSRGVHAGQINSKGYGKARPIATNRTPEGRQKNRRVEIFKKINK